MVHIIVNKSVHPIHQGTFHGKKGPVENMLSIGQGVQNIEKFPVDGKSQGGINHLKLTTPFLYILLNATPDY